MSKGFPDKAPRVTVAKAAKFQVPKELRGAVRASVKAARSANPHTGATEYRPKGIIRVFSKEEILQKLGIRQEHMANVNKVIAIPSKELNRLFPSSVGRRTIGKFEAISKNIYVDAEAIQEAQAAQRLIAHEAAHSYYHNLPSSDPRRKKDAEHFANIFGSLPGKLPEGTGPGRGWWGDSEGHAAARRK